MLKKIVASFATLLLAAGLSVVAVAAPASAHNAALSGVATCQADGTYSVTWTGTLTNYGNHKEIDIKVIKHEPAGSLINGVDGQVWLYEWTDHYANHQLPPWPTNGVFTYTQTNIPGTATSAMSGYQYDWKAGYSGDPEKTITLGGDCTKQTTPDAAADIKVNPATCESAATLELLTPTFATWGNVTGSYTVVATATDGHRFPSGNSPGIKVSSDGKTKTFTGKLDPKKTGNDCATRDASASVSTTPATCEAAEKDVVVTATNATYKVTYPTASTYKVTVTANDGHLFSDGTNKLVLTGSLAPKLTEECSFPVTVPTAKSITECGTYGSVTVPANTDQITYTLAGNGTTGINTVTATATAPYTLKDYPAGGWTFNLGAYTDCERTLTLTYVPACAPDDTNDWKIFNPGTDNLEVTYPGGTVTAIAGQYTAVSTPASDDTFTISWGATGSGIKPGEASATPGDDLPADDPACIKLAEPVAPTVTKVSECGVYGTVVAAETTGVVYEVTFDKETGDYTVVATPAFGYYFAGESQKITYTDSVGAYYECVEEPNATVAYGECVYNEDGTADQRHVWITFDNTASNKDVYFEVPYFSEYNQTVAKGEKVTFQVADIWPAGGGYQVKAAGQTFELEIPACDLPTLPLPIERDVVVSSYDCSTAVATVTTTTYTTNWIFDTEAVEWVQLPEVAGAPVVTTRPMTEDEISDETCLVAVTDPEASTCLSDTEATDLTSWIRVALDPKVEYRIDGVLVTTEYTSVTPGVHTVTADALGGYTLSGGNPTAWTDTHHEWTFTAADSSLECEPPTLATVTPEFSYTPLTCTAAGSYTLGELAAGTIQWTVNGKPVGVGTYPVTSAQTLTFAATPKNEADGLDPDWKNPDPIAFSQGGAPCDLVTLALTGATSPFGLIWVAMLLGLTGVGFVLIRRRTATEK